MINAKEQKFLNNLINKHHKISSNNKLSYSLLENAFSNTDIISGIKVLLSKKITMSSITQKFEYEFAKFVGSKHDGQYPVTSVVPSPKTPAAISVPAPSNIAQEISPG